MLINLNGFYFDAGSIYGLFLYIAKDRVALLPFPPFNLGTLGYPKLHINVLRYIAVFKKYFSPSASKGLGVA